MSCITNLTLRVRWQFEEGTYRCKEVYGGLGSPEDRAGKRVARSTFARRVRHIDAFNRSDEHHASEDVGANNAQIAHAVHMACVALPQLKKLTLSIRNQTSQIVPYELAKHHELLASLLIPSLLISSSLEVFIMSIPMFPMQGWVCNNVGTETLLEVAMDIGSMPIDENADILRRTISFASLWSEMLLKQGRWREDGLYRPLSANRKQRPRARAEFAINLLDRSQESHQRYTTASTLPLLPEDRQFLNIRQTADMVRWKEQKWCNAKGNSYHYYSPHRIETERSIIVRYALELDKAGRPVWGDFEVAKNRFKNCGYDLDWWSHVKGFCPRCSLPKPPVDERNDGSASSKEADNDE